MSDHDHHAHHQYGAAHRDPAPSAHHPSGTVADEANTVKDPVCGMTVDPATTPHHAEHTGVAYHFCSTGCRTKFVADPARYTAPKPALRAEPLAPGCWAGT